MAESLDKHTHFKSIEQFSCRNAPSWCESEGFEEAIGNVTIESDGEERAGSPNGMDEELK